MTDGQLMLWLWGKFFEKAIEAFGEELGRWLFERVTAQVLGARTCTTCVCPTCGGAVTGAG